MRTGYGIAGWFARLAIMAVPVAAFAWLAWQELVPSGTFVVRHAVGERSPFVDRLLPDARVEGPGTIVDDPVTFFAHPHRDFDTVDVEVRFRNHGAKVVELGALAEGGASYDLRPMQNLLIDMSGWSRLEQDGTVLLQRVPRYDSVEAFLKDPPPRHEVATSRIALGAPYRIPGYAPSDQPRTTEATLRGSHSFKTYVKDETLSFSFAFDDMNRDEGADPVSATVTDERGREVASASMPDDGDLSALGRAGPRRHLDLSVPGLPEGPYKVELRATRDVFFRSFATAQQKAVFLNDVFLGDEAGYRDVPREARFWTEAKHLNFSTTHASGAQDLRVGAATVALKAPYEKVAHEVAEDGVVRVSAPSGDVLVEGDGHVAFAPEQFFNPDPVRLDWNTDLDRLGVDYAIAAYASPREEDGWTVARASFDARSLDRASGAWKFAFSVPGVKAQGASVEIGRIDMAWHREPLTWQALLEAVKRKLGL